MNRKRNLSRLPALLSLFLVSGLTGMHPALAQQGAQPDRAAFVTLLGDDTLAVERFTHTVDGLEAEVVLRTPRTTLHQYRIEFDGDEKLSRYEATVRDPKDASSAPIRKEVVEPAGDSLKLTITENGASETRTISGDAGALPFIDMVHWPFELLFMRARASQQDSLEAPLFTGRGVQPFVVRNAGSDHMVLVHPYRGTMDVTVDSEGRLLTLDAANTTRKLVVTRVPDADIEAAAARFAALDAAGNSFGPLSGRGETVARVHGANIRVDYGQPARRGRELFGALVPWGQVWRTGANQATHFETDHPLTLGDLSVPAGTYTLFTVPEPNGGSLIVNRQTGQNGMNYDQTQDLGRVEMTTSELPSDVELFTIDVEETDAGGELQLKWGRTVFTVPFTVEN